MRIIFSICFILVFNISYSQTVFKLICSKQLDSKLEYIDSVNIFKFEKESITHINSFKKDTTYLILSRGIQGESLLYYYSKTDKISYNYYSKVVILYLKNKPKYFCKCEIN